jgi:acyl-CoA synthetase (NDP forming)
LTNPLDINPSADDETHALAARILVADNGVDALVIGLDPLSPSTMTLDDNPRKSYTMDSEKSIKNLMISLVKASEKPIVTVIDGGKLYDPLRDILIENGIPVFEVCDRAVAALSLYMQGRLEVQRLRSEGRDLS